MNGSRAPGSHPALPLSPAELGREGRRAVEAGARALHIHPRDTDGAETLNAAAVEAALVKVRACCPSVPVGVSTGAWIEPDLAARLAHVRSWTTLPDFASVNLSEEGAEEMCRLLLEKGVGVEAGVWSEADARLLHKLRIADRSVRVLIELIDEQVVADALAMVSQIERVFDAAGIRTPRLLHGEGALAWPMLQAAIARGYDIRIGLEDTLALPDGTVALDNAQMVAIAKMYVSAASAAG